MRVMHLDLFGLLIQTNAPASNSFTKRRQWLPEGGYSSQYLGCHLPHETGGRGSS